jgi:hypothetical protein
MVLSDVFAESLAPSHSIRLFVHLQPSDDDSHPWRLASRSATRPLLPEAVEYPAVLNRSSCHALRSRIDRGDSNMAQAT